MARIQRTTLIWALNKAIKEQEKVEKKLNYGTSSAFLVSLKQLLKGVVDGEQVVVLESNNV